MYRPVSLGRGAQANVAPEYVRHPMIAEHAYAEWRVGWSRTISRALRGN